MSLETFANSPKAESCRRVDFDSVTVVDSRCGPVLQVKGSAPCSNMTISLIPRVYVMCPDYWGIEVVGCLPGGFCLTALKNYDESILLKGAIGSKGIEVMGAAKNEKVDVKGGCRTSEKLG